MHVGYSSDRKVCRNKYPDSGDCGGFALMYMSYLMLDRTPTFSSDLADFFRKKIVLDLFMGDIV